MVLDTNDLVSPLWSSNSKPASIVNSVLTLQFLVYYDYRILDEYYNVLRYPTFVFTEWEIEAPLRFISRNEISVIVVPLPDIPFTDEDNKTFFEVAESCHTLLSQETQNTIHRIAGSLYLQVT